MRTESAKPQDITRAWYVVDAEGLSLGRLSSRIAMVLRGKHKAIFTPHVDTGDFVVVVNCEKIRLTGNKLTDKPYHHHTGYFGGIKTIMADKLLEKRPQDLIKIAVKGMLPKTPLGRAMFKKLKVYAGPQHPHAAQKPEALTF